MAVRGIISYWWLPIISGLVWLGMLLGMLLHWVVDKNKQPYGFMDPDATIVYISDIGAAKLKPLFIAGSVVVTVFLDLSFVAERWLRHKGRLVPNASRGEKALAVLTILFALLGTAGLILLSIFDTKRHHRLHYVFLLFFIVGYLLSAIFTCWEYQRLGIKNRDHRVLRISFWVKLTFVLVEFVLAIVFAGTTFTKHPNIAAIFEWVIAAVFTFYILSFFIDLYPAIFTKSRSARFAKPATPMEMEEASPSSDTPRPHSRSHQGQAVQNGS
ncbi:hypothetical protein K4F52_007606 [Lecanicillium sp. MT-2017a]|nr:hypothetical protein K4F52_007606 [Lecanicillium sp. MT-2017a]